MSPEAQQTIGVTQIAEMTGVRPSAVSNWRRRHSDFPASVGTAPGGGDLFLLTEVKEWLRNHNRTIHSMDVGRAVWLALDRARGAMSTETAVDTALAALALADRATDGERAALLQAAPGRDTVECLDEIDRRVAAEDPSYSPITEIVRLREPDAVSPIVRAAFEPTTQSERCQGFEYLLAARRKSLRQGAEHESAPSLASLIVELAAPLQGTIVDPAAGIGTLLLEAAGAVQKGARAQLLGEDINVGASATARERLRLHGIQARVRRSNGLIDTSLEPGAADVVLLDAPLGMRLRPEDVEPHDPRWIAGTPGRNGDFAWLQHAVWLTKPASGRAYVTSTTGATFRSGREGKIRSEMIRRGLVEAVIALPPGAAGRTTQVPLIIWVLQRPEGGRAAESILLIDASQQAHRGDEPLPPSLREHIAATLRSFRGGSFNPQPGFAVSVSSIELLGSDAVVTPTRWVGGEDEATILADMADAQRASAGALKRLTALNAPVVALASLTERRAPRRVADLLADGHMELLRGLRVTDENLSSEGVALLGAPEVRLRDPEQRFLNPTAIPPNAPLTRPGDVIVVPISRPPRAFVDTEGGRLLVSPLVALRSHLDALPGPLVAAFIASDRNAQASTGSTIPHVRIQDLEIPHLSEQEARVSLEALTALQNQGDLAERIAATSALTRKALINGLMSGGFVPNLDGEPA